VIISEEEAEKEFGLKLGKAAVLSFKANQALTVCYIQTRVYILPETRDNENQCLFQIREYSLKFSTGC
jgi:hypothetical protein